MNPKDVKIGETYYVRVKVEHIDEDGWIKVRTNEKSISFILAPREAEFISPLPKYDPCRPFKKGDRVKPVKRYGRYPDDDVLLNFVYTVVEDEKGGRVHIACSDEKVSLAYHVTALYLELVTPVEEIEPYIVTYDDKFYHIHKHGEEASIAVYSEARHPNAKAAAEAECARLNAEDLQSTINNQQ